MNFIQNNWPFLALIAWFGYRWWRAQRVAAMLPALRSRGVTLVDVRSTSEFASGSASGTVNIPLPELSSRLGEIPRDVPVVVGCASGTRSGMAARVLKKNGYAEVYNIGAWSNFLK